MPENVTVFAVVFEIVNEKFFVLFLTKSQLNVFELSVTELTSSKSLANEIKSRWFVRSEEAIVLSFAALVIEYRIVPFVGVAGCDGEAAAVPARYVTTPVEDT